jgi:Carbohydrate binding module (family 6).
LSESIKNQDTITGFKVKVDTLAVAIDSIVLGSSLTQIVINLKDSISRNDSVFLSYNDGNILSKFGVSLKNFSDTLVDNLLTGASPRIVDAQTTTDGRSIIVKFNKTMKLPDDASDLTFTVKYNGDKNFVLSPPSFGNDSTSLVYPMKVDTTFAEYSLFLSYGGGSIISSDTGLLKPFTNISVTNNSFGLPMHIKSGAVSSDGNSIVVQCNKSVAVAIEQRHYFTLKINGVVASVSDLSIANTITITPANTIHYGDVVTLSYNPGCIMATDSGVLLGFNDYLITNPIIEPSWITVPGKVEAENYMSQYGTQSESTGDAGGGQDVGWIDDGDWLEYAINNTTTDSVFNVTFRLASPYGGGLLAVYLDNAKLGQISVSNTGGWQIYSSVAATMKIKPSKHFLKLYVTKGGFNINYTNIQRIASGVSMLKDDNLKVYPNPASTQIFIETSDFKYNKVEISNSVGDIVISKQLTYEPKIHFPINLSNGLYFVKISNAKEFQLRKILVQN